MVTHDIPFINGCLVMRAVSSCVSNGNSFLFLLLVSLGPEGPKQLKKVSYMIYL